MCSCTVLSHHPVLCITPESVCTRTRALCKCASSLLNALRFLSNASLLLTHSPLPSDINIALRKIVCLLKPDKHITHDPDTGAMTIRTITTFRNFDMDFTIGQEFTEDLGPVDGRKCQVIGT